jgi:hypothetical protein
MQATLTFNLPEERTEFELAANGLKWMSVSHEMAEYLRQQLKYHSEKYTDDQYLVIEEMRKKLIDLISEEGLTLDS